MINPAYRIYYAGDEYLDVLKGFLEKEQAIYPTYLGCAYALTKPIYRETIQIEGFIHRDEKAVDSKTVVPTSIIKELRLKEDRHYCRAGGFMYQYKGDRTFERSIDFIYDQRGQSITFVISSVPAEFNIKIGSIGEEIICLC